MALVSRLPPQQGPCGRDILDALKEVTGPATRLPKREKSPIPLVRRGITASAFPNNDLSQEGEAGKEGKASPSRRGDLPRDIKVSPSPRRVRNPPPPREAKVAPPAGKAKSTPPPREANGQPSLMAGDDRSTTASGKPLLAKDTSNGKSEVPAQLEVVEEATPHLSRCLAHKDYKYVDHASPEGTPKMAEGAGSSQDEGVNVLGAEVVEAVGALLNSVHPTQLHEAASVVRNAVADAGVEETRTLLGLSLMPGLLRMLQVSDAALQEDAVMCLLDMMRHERLRPLLEMEGIPNRMAQALKSCKTLSAKEGIIAALCLMTRTPVQAFMLVKSGAVQHMVTMLGDGLGEPPKDEAVSDFPSQQPLSPSACLSPSNFHDVHHDAAASVQAGTDTSAGGQPRDGAPASSALKEQTAASDSVLAQGSPGEGSLSYPASDKTPAVSQNSSGIQTRATPCSCPKARLELGGSVCGLGHHTDPEFNPLCSEIPGRGVECALRALLHFCRFPYIVKALRELGAASRISELMSTGVQLSPLEEMALIDLVP